MSKRIFFKFIFISIITLVTFSSCKKEEINSVNLEFFPDTLLFDYDVDTNTVVLNCFGDIQTTWSLSSLPSYINVSPTSGTLTPGQSITLNVILDRSGFVSNDTYLDAIVITYTLPSLLKISSLSLISCIPLLLCLSPLCKALRVRA